jgi:glycosyltransferase involved in cell wall biosynthesis
MDGGSTDESTVILNQSGQHVRWKSEPDRGQSHALNKALEASRGEIIGWLNSDDAYVDRRSVEVAVRALEGNPSVGVVYGHGLLVNQQNDVLQYLWAPNFNSTLFRYGTFFVQPSVFIRRSIIGDRLVSEDLHYVMDRDLWWRLYDVTRFKRIDMVIGLDRHQPSRKVLQSGYNDERFIYDAAHGINSQSVRGRGIRKVLKIGIRLRGLAGAYSVPNTIDPAIQLDFGSRWSRVVHQAVTPRRKMPS